ncbi:MAG: ABC transporter ATP-binding protein [Raoultibacter sp.]|jgi:energy-coupling factor transporter ATP-binding protein EcfA2
MNNELTQSETNSPTNSASPAIKIDNLSFAYSEESPLFSNLSLTVKRQDFTLLVGETGSGKSSLLRLLKNELAPRGTQSGSIEVFGRANTELSTYDSATQIGYLSQNVESQIICENVWHELAFGCENLNLSPELIRRRVAEIVAFFGIEAWLHAKTDELSGGQKQTLVLASILIMQPQILLLDEPTSQLDPIAEKNFAHLLFRINRELGTSILLATHEPEVLASYATKTIKLADGRIQASDSMRMQQKQRFEQPSVELESAVPHMLDSAGSSPSGLGCAKTIAHQDKQAILLRSVTFKYDREEAAVLQDLDLQITQGNIHALVGGNGSGKTTLLMTMAGILKPQKGKIKNTLAASQAYLPQDPKVLFVCDTTFDELMELQKRSSVEDEAVWCMLEKLKLKNEAQRHPYDLSGGEQQKLALGKLMFTEPALLLLDEPTKGLDARTKCELANTLLALRVKGVTIVMASHDLSFVSQVADTTSMLFDAQVVCTEPTAEFFANNMFYRPRPDEFIRRWQKGEPC